MLLPPRKSSLPRSPGGLRAGDFFPKGSMQLTRERHYEIENSLSYLGVAHGGEGAAQLTAFAHHEVGDFGLPVWSERNRSCRRSGASIREEVAGRDVEKIGKLLQATGADPIRPILVLLDLLVADIERFAHLGLAHFQGETAHLHAGSDLRVDGVWRFHRSSIYIS